MVDYIMEMQKVSKQVDRFIENVRKTRNLNIQDYKGICDRVFDTYKKAGSSGAIHPGPEQGRKWQQEQNEKLSKLVKWIREQKKLKINCLIYDDKPLGLLLDWEEK